MSIEIIDGFTIISEILTGVILYEVDDKLSYSVEPVRIRILIKNKRKTIVKTNKYLNCNKWKMSDSLGINNDNKLYDIKTMLEHEKRKAIKKAKWMHRK